MTLGVGYVTLGVGYVTLGVRCVGCACSVLYVTMVVQESRHVVCKPAVSANIALLCCGQCPYHQAL